VSNATKTAPASPSIPPEAIRRAWFGEFGYAGDLDEVVTLRSPALGTATVANVWGVLKGLRTLQSEFNSLFRRTCLSVATGERVIDHLRRLSEIEHGALTDATTGDFLPGRTEIIRALLDIDPETVTCEWVAEPLARRTALAKASEEVREAA